MKRYALWVLVASVGISALLGCMALLSSDFGKTQGKVLLSTLVVAQASLLAMVCGVSMGRSATAPLAKVGVVLAIVTAPVLLAAIWGEVDGPSFWRVVGTLEVTAVAIAHASLLLVARLRPARRWMLAATLVGILLLSGLILGLIWEAVHDDSVWRPLGILSILTCAGTILVWVFHRIDRGAAGAAPGTSASSVAPAPPSSGDAARAIRHCVACGADRIEASAVGVHCYACGAQLRVTLDSAGARR